MHPEQIKAEVRMRGSSFAQIARTLQINRVTVSTVAQGITTSARTAQCIADLLGVPASKLWPGKYKKLA